MRNYYLENKSSLVKTNEGDLILDSHKLSYHYERVEAWENGEKIPPIPFVEHLSIFKFWDIQMLTTLPRYLISLKKNPCLTSIKYV